MQRKGNKRFFSHSSLLYHRPTQVKIVPSRELWPYIETEKPRKLILFDDPQEIQKKFFSPLYAIFRYTRPIPIPSLPSMPCRHIPQLTSLIPDSCYLEVYHPQSLEILPSIASKSRALQWLCANKFDCKMEDILAMGDGTNDVQMVPLSFFFLCSFSLLLSIYLSLSRFTHNSLCNLSSPLPPPPLSLSLSPSSVIVVSG